MAERARPTDDELGQRGYRAFLTQAPEAVRATPAPWSEIPEALRKHLTAVAIDLYQQGENDGYTTALRATLPSGRLGAAGEIDDAADLIGAVMRTNGVGEAAIYEARKVLKERARELRAEGAADRKREERP